jgi:ABC-type multidrug transport system fused ATPase/permease subunit
VVVKQLIAAFRRGYRRLEKHGKRVLWSYGGALIAVAGLDGLALVVLSKIIVDATRESAPTELGEMKGIIALIVILFVLRSAVATFISWVGMKEFSSQEVVIGQQNFKTLESLPWVLRSQLNASDYSAAVDRGPFGLVQCFLLPAVTLIAEVATAVVILFIVFFLQPVTALTAMVFFVVVAVIQHRLLSVATGRSGLAVVARGNSTQDLLVDAYQMSKVLQVMPSSSLGTVMTKSRTELAQARARNDFMRALPRYFMEAVLALGFMLIASVTYLAQGERSVVPAITLFAAAGLRLLPIVNRIQGLILQLVAEHPMALRALDVHPLVSQAPHTSSIDNENVSTPNESNDVLLTFDQVSFSYPGNESFGVRDINFSIRRGLRYAIVGPSGSGKTTLADMCLGVIEPTSGSITWSGALEEPRVGYVPQDTYIGLASLVGNVALEWDDTAINTSNAETALQQAQLGTSDLKSQTTPGAEPTKLLMSGGQRQRVGLARALYRTPDFLVLDEATSSLDSETEFEVIQAIRSLPASTTVLTIAHRLSTIRDSDQVIYIKDGQILGTGSFDELTAQLPEFARQVELAMRHNDLLE